MMLYLAMMIGFAAVPSAVLLALNYRHVNMKALLVAEVILFAIGTTWDWISVDNGIWAFFPGELVGIYIGILPLEEYLFMIFVPLLSINVFAIIMRNLVGKKGMMSIRDSSGTLRDVTCEIDGKIARCDVE